MFYTVGIDVGSSAIKTVLFSFDKNGENEKLLAKDLSKIRKRDTKEVIRISFQNVLHDAGLQERDIAYIGTTGEGEMVDFRRGHFYSMTTHARGGIYLHPHLNAVIDMGALHSKVVMIDDKSKVLDYRMTSQCASGSGQFLENISRYLGIAMEDIGRLSKEADNPEVVSNICAVLSETDVINMVSRGISASNILKGIHLSMGRRMVRLLRALKGRGLVMITGGLANDTGLLAAMQELAVKDDMQVEFIAHLDSIFAGAMGAGLWSGFRYLKLQNAESIKGSHANTPQQ